MKLYLPNGGILELTEPTTITNNGTVYRVIRASDNRMVMDIVDGIVIIYNSFYHRYTPPTVPLSPAQVVNMIEVEKLPHAVITSLKNKTSKYQVRKKTWRK